MLHECFKMLKTFEIWVSTAPKYCRQFSSRANTRPRHVSNLKRVVPVSVQSQKQKYDGRSHPQVERFKTSVQQFRQDFRKEIEEHGDVLEDPNVDVFSKNFDAYTQDVARMKENIKRQKMIRKHFKDVQPKETSLLTWAEKENIRYLCENEPSEWTPERIAETYPISANGVHKLLKSSLQMRTSKDILRHDTSLAEKIANYKSGKYEMTEELERRLKIRELVPLRLGDLGRRAKEICAAENEPKVLGEFGKLVAPPEMQSAQNKLKTPSMKQLSDRLDFASDKKDSNIFMSPRELNQILPSKTMMTFHEFESKMKEQDDKKLSEDMKYMLTIKEPPKDQPNSRAKPVVAMDVEKDSTLHKVKKFVTPNADDNVTVNLEGSSSYVYSPETGYEKPYEQSSSSFLEKITIPEELKRPGATYKVGNCFYDDEGDFLYRIP